MGKYDDGDTGDDIWWWDDATDIGWDDAIDIGGDDMLDVEDDDIDIGSELWSEIAGELSADIWEELGGESFNISNPKFNGAKKWLNWVKQMLVHLVRYLLVMVEKVEYN